MTFRSFIIDLIVLAACAFLVMGCANDAYLAAVKAQADAYREAETARAHAQEARYNALAKVAGTDATSNVAVAFAVAFGDATTRAPEPMPVVKPPRDGWDYAAMILDRVVSVAGIVYPVKVAGDVAMSQARYQSEERQSLYGAFTASSASSVSAVRDVSLGGFGVLRDTSIAAISRPPSVNVTAGRDANLGGSLTSSQNTTTTMDDHSDRTFLPCPSGTAPAPGGGCVSTTPTPK